MRSRFRVILTLFNFITSLGIRTRIRFRRLLVTNICVTSKKILFDRGRIFDAQADAYVLYFMSNKSALRVGFVKS